MQYNTLPGTIVACPSCKGFNKLPDVTSLSWCYLQHSIIIGSQRWCPTDCRASKSGSSTSRQVPRVRRKPRGSSTRLFLTVIIPFKVNSWCQECGQWFYCTESLDLNFMCRLCLSCDVRLHARGKRAAHQVNCIARAFFFENWSCGISLFFVS